MSTGPGALRGGAPGKVMGEIGWPPVGYTTFSPMALSTRVKTQGGGGVQKIVLGDVGALRQPRQCLGRPVKTALTRHVRTVVVKLPIKDLEIREYEG